MGVHHNNIARNHIKPTARIKVVMLSAAVIFTVATVGSMFGVQNAYARDYNAEIKALQNQINDYNNRSSDLGKQADTLNGKIAELQNQQNEIQAQINLSSAKKARLEQQISDNQDKIKQQTKTLSSTLQNMYYSGQTSALDVLMNSDSVSDYVDRQARQQSVSDQITDSVNKVKDLKKQLEGQKKEVERVISVQESQKEDLSYSRNQQQKLLDDTQGQEAKYQELSKSTQAHMAQVQKEQQDAIRSYQNSHRGASGEIKANSQCGGGYPFCKSSPDSSQVSGGFYSSGNARECVNYVQWRIFQATGRNERHGHAGSWSSVANSRAKVNTVAIIGYGSLPYGHVAWVEQVGSGDREGQVYVSEYNWSPYDYTERWVPISSFTGGFYDPSK